MTLDIISRIFKSSHMGETFNAALRCEHDSSTPVTIHDFTRLRDVLILKFMIVSVKRAMEFAECNLGEYAEIERRPACETNPECYVIRVSNHKTARQGKFSEHINFLTFV